VSGTATATCCRLCGGDRLDVVLAHERAPRNVSYLPRAEELADDAPTSVEVLRCAGCGFVQLTEPPSETYYDDYLMTVSHSAQMRRYQQAQAERFVERFGLRGKRVVEAGCGDGHYLSILAGLDVDAVGTEPSARFRDVALETGLPIHGGYVTVADGVPGAPYDGFVTREVLEHVPDPNDFLRALRECLAPDGVGLVEVPSLEQALERGRFYDFFPDHVNYFSAGTLARALETNGFLVCEVSRGMNGEYLEAWVRADAGRDLPSLRRAVDSTTADLRAFLDGCADSGRRVAVWGSGAKGLTTMAVAGVDGTDVAYVVDADPYKVGRFTPVSHLPVVPPAHLAEEPVDAIVVTALAYRDEIVAALRGELGFAGTIAVLGPRLELLEPPARA
jgi:SAM-dependent methyltransferase